LEVRLLEPVVRVVLLHRQQVLDFAVLFTLRAAPLVFEVLFELLRRVLLVGEFLFDVVVLRRRGLFQLGIVLFSM
jgi:hypothetical protein